jgi:hypothetical protein
VLLAQMTVTTVSTAYGSSGRRSAPIDGDTPHYADPGPIRKAVR